MSDWREQLLRSPALIQEHSDEALAVTRVLRGLGAKREQIGRLCKQLGIEYREEETTFQRVIGIFRAACPSTDLVTVFDVKSGKKPDSLNDELLADPRSAVVFYRVKGKQAMTAFVKGVELSGSPLGAIVLQPGIRYVACRDGIQLWEQDPVLLVRSFQTRREL